MANYATIKNAKKIPHEQMLSKISSHLKRKFGLNVTGIYHPKDALELQINQISFYIYLQGNKYSMLDCADTALSRSEMDSEYKKQGLINGSYYLGLACGYCFIYEYIKNYLAKTQGVMIDSDGAGPYPPFEDKERFDSFTAWMDYCESRVKQEHFLMHVMRMAAVPSKKKIIQQELKYFPELK